MPQLQPARFKPEALAQGFKQRVAEWDQGIRAYFGKFRHRLRNLPQTNYELGVEFGKRGEVKDAKFRFKVALYFAPEFTAAWYNLGCCQLALNEKQGAMHSFQRTLQLDPTHSDAKFMLSTIDPAQLATQDRPKRMPGHMMEGFFTRVAAQYEASEMQAGYEGHVNLHTRVRPMLQNGEVRMLDIGCGTGLASIPWRKEARGIVGVDITSAMAMVARTAKVEGVPVFEAVHVLDASSPHFTLAEAPFKLVIALNVLPYVGEASAFVTNAAKMVENGGLVALTHEVFTGREGYGVLTTTGRFGHSVEYLRQLAVAAGLTPLEQDVLTLYPNVKASLVLFTKKAVA